MSQCLYREIKENQTVTGLSLTRHWGESYDIKWKEKEELYILSRYTQRHMLHVSRLSKRARKRQACSGSPTLEIMCLIWYHIMERCVCVCVYSDYFKDLYVASKVIEIYWNIRAVKMHTSEKNNFR